MENNKMYENSQQANNMDRTLNKTNLVPSLVPAGLVATAEKSDWDVWTELDLSTGWEIEIGETDRNIWHHLKTKRLLWNAKLCVQPSIKTWVGLNFNENLEQF